MIYVHASLPGIKPTSPAGPALAGGFFSTESPGKPLTELKSDLWGLVAESSNQLPFGVMRPPLKTEWSLWDWPSTLRLLTQSQTLGQRGRRVQRLRVWLRSTPHP